jgi:hypothetical protein
MKLFELFTNHSHHWGVPHRPFDDNRLMQTCYECGAERFVKVSFPPSGDWRMRLAITEKEVAA